MAVENFVRNVRKVFEKYEQVQKKVSCSVYDFPAMFLRPLSYRIDANGTYATLLRCETTLETSARTAWTRAAYAVKESLYVFFLRTCSMLESHPYEFIGLTHIRPC